MKSRHKQIKAIFSTYVEVFLFKTKRCGTILDFLHVCGGVSEKSLMRWTNTIFSPRMWRCFRGPFVIFAQIDIFSTYVEVFPIRCITRF